MTDGTEIRTHVVVWAGGEKAADVIGRSGLPQGRGGRVDVDPDLTVDGFPGVYVLGDAANIRNEDGDVLPQLGSVAQQSGKWAADNIARELDGHDRRPFEYHDKGIMAMIGRNAAIAELGKGRHEIDGPFAFAAWLGVHATLLEGTRQKLGALMTWGWDYASRSGRPPSPIAPTPTPSTGTMTTAISIPRPHTLHRMTRRSDAAPAASDCLCEVRHGRVTALGDG